MGSHKCVLHTPTDSSSENGVFTIYYSENDQLRKENFSWYPSGRTYDQALSLAEEFLRNIGIQIE